MLEKSGGYFEVLMECVVVEDGLYELCFLPEARQVQYLLTDVSGVVAISIDTRGIGESLLSLQPKAQRSQWCGYILSSAWWRFVLWRLVFFALSSKCKVLVRVVSIRVLIQV